MNIHLPPDDDNDGEIDWTALKCRHGCAAEVVGLFHAPDGCICFSDPVQALCAQHAVKGMQNNRNMNIIILRY